MTKILVIEDESLLREEVIDWLILEGYEAVGAANGRDGLEYVLRHQPDLILCDITLPYLDGFGVLMEITANPAAIGIPFIFMTARASHEDIRQGMGLGADDYVTKPFSRMELLQTIQARLEKKATQEQNHRRELEQLQEILEAEREQRFLKTKLVAMFSHDFRNPLSSILSSATLLRDYADRMDDERQLAHFNRIEASVRRLMQMLDDMLMVAKMETGNFEFKPELMDIANFLQRMVEEFQTIHRETHTLTFESHFVGTLMADPRLLRQAVANLISNAIKYSPPGSEVWVVLDKHESHCFISVQDQGIGIPEAEQARMFEGFQRGSNVSSISGTGLGLAIVKQVVDLHGGSAHLESEVQVGTKAVISIPLHSVNKILMSSEQNTSSQFP